MRWDCRLPLHGSLFQKLNYLGQFLVVEVYALLRIGGEIYLALVAPKGDSTFLLQGVAETTS